MDSATSPAATAAPHPARDGRDILVDPDLVVADISDRALRLALLLAWHDEGGYAPIDCRDVVSDATLAQQLGCSLADVRVAWAELSARRGLADGIAIPTRHECADGDW